MDLHASVLRIRQKCEQLRRLGPELQERFPQDHPYQLGEPISEHVIHQFEQEYGYQLPEEYALFFTSVGNGGAGPGGGLRKLEATITSFANKEPFPYLPDSKNTRPTTDGCVVITEKDDDWEYCLLVINGSQRGMVWATAYARKFTAIVPLRAKDGRQATFLVWYEEWLDSVLGRFWEGESTTIVSCPTCRQRLRVPIARGDLALTCPVCRERWDWSPEAGERA
jgi:hypothetical protein